MINRFVLTSIIVFTFFAFSSALDVPYSEQPLYSDNNIIDNFVCSDPPDASKINLETKCWIWHDYKNLYFSWIVEIDNQFIIGKYSSYDVSAQSDNLCVQVITDLTNYYSYGFLAYPLESKSDFVRSTEHALDYDWSSTYEYSSNNQDSTWNVVMKIPFKDLRFEGKPPYKWKLILSRYTKFDNKLYTNTFLTTQLGKDYFRNASDLTISGNINDQKDFVVRPYTVVKTDLIEKEINYDLENIGLDLSFRPNSSSKIKLAYNPDFSDVPIDDETNNFNSKYVTYYPENRYFFIKDLNALGVSSNTFYSRQIVQPEFAVKFTGRTDKLTYGILSSKAKEVAEGNMIKNSNDIYNIVAFKPSGENFSCQFTFLNRMNDNYHNEVLHINPNWEFSKDQYLWFDANLSTKKNQENELLNGYYGMVGYEFGITDFNFSISMKQMSKNYAVDMGKIYEDDFYGWNINSKLIRKLNNDHLRSITSNLNASEEIDNTTSDLLERYAHFDFKLTSNYHLDFELDCVYVKELYIEKYFNKYQISLHTSWNKPKFVSLFFGYNHLNNIIYMLQDDYKGSSMQFGLKGIINKYISYTITADNMRYFNIPKNTNFDADYWFSNFDFSVSLSNKLDLTSGARYNNYEKTIDDIKYSQHIGLFSNLRWQFRKQSFVYFGYNSSENKITQVNQYEHKQFYIKISYSF
ncbi:MAG: hypothetical protein K9N07_03690 [Candidatus Cloacimonetes bacterium]|nr:hypothetical protein [Candidatus Cloacimonadota bacterium]